MHVGSLTSRFLGNLVRLGLANPILPVCDSRFLQRIRPEHGGHTRVSFTIRRNVKSLSVFLYGMNLFEFMLNVLEIHQCSLYQSKLQAPGFWSVSFFH